MRRWGRNLNELFQRFFSWQASRKTHDQKVKILITRRIIIACCVTSILLHQYLVNLAIDHQRSGKTCLTTESSNTVFQNFLKHFALIHLFILMCSNQLQRIFRVAQVRWHADADNGWKLSEWQRRKSMCKTMRKRSRKSKTRNIVSDGIRAAVIDQVLVQGMTMREAPPPSGLFKVIVSFYVFCSFKVYSIHLTEQYTPCQQKGDWKRNTFSLFTGFVLLWAYYIFML